MEKNISDKLKTIFLVPYCHADYAWTNRREWHITRYIECIDRTLDLFKRRKDYVFCIDNFQHFVEPYLEYRPERKRDLEKFIGSGNICFSNGGYVLARPSYSGEETYVRNMIAGHRAMKKLGAKNIDFCFNADTACGHSQLPQILNLCGIKYYRYFRSEAGQNFKKIPREFVYCGGNGSKIIVSRGNYTLNFLDAIDENCDFDSEWEKIKTAVEADLRERCEGTDADCAMLFCAYDDILPEYSGFDRKIKLFDFIDEWNRREKSEIVIAAPEQYFKRLKKQPLPEINFPTEQSELSYNLPMKGDGSFWKLRKLLANAILQAETLHAMYIFTCGGAERADFDGYWKDLFEISGHAMEFLLNSDYEYLFTLAQGALDKVRILCDDYRRKIACTRGKKGAYVFINPTGAEYSGTVTVHVTDVFGVRKGEFFDGRGNKKVSQLIKRYCGDKKYVSFDYQGADYAVNVTIPAFGTECLYFKESGEDEEIQFRKHEIVCGEREIVGLKDCRIEIDENGGIFISKGSISRPLGNEIGFSPSEPQKNWLTVYSRENKKTMKAKRVTVLNNGALYSEVLVDGDLDGMKCVQIIRTDAVRKEINFETVIYGDGREGYFTADFAADEDSEIFADIPFGLEKRNPREEISYGGLDSRDSAGFCEQDIKGQIYGTNFVSYFNCGERNSILSEDCSIYYIFDNNRMSLVLNRALEKDARPESGLDAWVRDLPDAVTAYGKNSFRYTLSLEKDVMKLPAAVKHKVCPPAAVKKFNLTEGPENSSMFSADDFMVATACFADKGKKSVNLRMYNLLDEDKNFSVKYGFDVKKIQKCDLLGNRKKREGDKPFKAGPREIVTLKIFADERKK